MEHREIHGLNYYKLIKAKITDKVKIRADAFLMRQKFSSNKIQTKYNELKKFVPAAIVMYLDIDQEIWSKESILLTIIFLNLSIYLKHIYTNTRWIRAYSKNYKYSIINIANHIELFMFLFDGHMTVWTVSK